MIQFNNRVGAGGCIEDELTLRIATITLAFRNLPLGLGPFVSGNRSANVHGLPEVPPGLRRT